MPTAPEHIVLCIVICYNKNFLVLAIHLAGWAIFLLVTSMSRKANITLEEPEETSSEQIACLFTCCFYEMLQNFSVKESGRRKEAREDINQKGIGFYGCF